MKLQITLTIAILSFCGCALAKDLASTVPPDILKQFNKDIISGKQPKIAKIGITQEEIFSLRQILKEDFVQLDFSPSDLSTIELDILKNWIMGQHKKILLIGRDLENYQELFEFNAAGGKEKKWVAFSLNHEMPVCTDVSEVSAYNCSYIETKHPSDLEAVAWIDHDKTRPLMGTFTYGRARVYFMPGLSRSDYRGADKDRLLLNLLHWMMGLKIPGATDRNIAGGINAGATSLKEAEKYDQITFRNGDAASGAVLDKMFFISTPFVIPPIDFNTKYIKMIIFKGGGLNIDILILKNGDQFGGTVQNETIKLSSVTGKQVELDKGKIREIVFRSKR